LSTTTHNYKKLAIEERRRKVAAYLARSMTQQEIADKLGCDQSVISDDVKALRLMSQQFIYDLAKSDLAFYYKDCINGIEECRREAWRIYHHYENVTGSEYAKVKLMALKIAIQANELKHKLSSDGPNILAVNTMSEKIDHIEQSIKEANR
jgi:hypothetical protein